MDDEESEIQEPSDDSDRQEEYEEGIDEDTDSEPGDLPKTKDKGDKTEKSSWMTSFVRFLWKKKTANPENQVFPLSSKKESAIKEEDEVQGSTTVMKKSRWALVSGYIPNLDTELNFLDSFQKTVKTPDIMTFLKNKKNIFMDSEPFASGNFGSIHSAFLETENGLIKKVAIKEQLMVSQSDINSVKNEVEIMQNVIHANLVNSIDVFRFEDKVYMIMPLAEGDLHGFVFHENFLSIKSIRKIFGQMVLGLQFLHSRGFCHRDFKLANVLVMNKKENTIKITDFGLSRSHYSKNRGIIMAKSYCGTRETCAPEVLRIKLSSDLEEPRKEREPYNPFFADLWSLGVCLFEMTTKQRPFNTKLPMSALISVMENEKYSFGVRGPSIPDNLKLLIQELLNPEPIARLPCHTILRHVFMKKFT